VDLALFTDCIDRANHSTRTTIDATFINPMSSHSIFLALQDCNLKLTEMLQVATRPKNQPRRPSQQQQPILLDQF
jgi:hypothetical protein